MSKAKPTHIEKLTQELISKMDRQFKQNTEIAVQLRAIFNLLVKEIDNELPKHDRL